MKIGLCITILAILNAVTVCPLAAQSEQSQEGTIVNVQKQDVATPPVRTGASANRAPLQSHYNLYNVSLQLNLDFPGDTLKMQIVQHKVSRAGACAQAVPGKH